MNDRVLQWTGVGVLAAGLSTGMLFSPGVAAAAPDSGADSGPANSSQSAAGKDGTKDSEDTSPSPGSELGAEDQDDQDDQDGTDVTDVEQVAGDEQAGEEGQDAGEAGDAGRRRGNDRTARTQQSGTSDDRTAASLTTDKDDKDDTDDKDDSDATRDKDVDLGVPDQAAAQQDPVPDGGAVAVTAPAAIEAPKTDATVSEPAEPDVVDTIVGAVSAVVGTLLSPFAANSTTPDVPAAEPQMWTLAAASRREFENAFESPSLAEATAPVENSLTYTPPPAFQDQIALVFQEVLQTITKVTGINTTAVIGSLLSSKNPPFFLTFGLDTRKTVFTSVDGTQWDVWEIKPPESTDKTVIAFHGGGWVLEPSLLNWSDYMAMARETGATVVVPIYPLATSEAGRATEVLPDAADFITQRIQASGGPENVSLYGDSAGASIAASAMRVLLLAGKPVPSSAVLVSLVADSSLQNPDIRDVDDPLFDVDNAEDVWESRYYDGISKTDPLVSPLFWTDDLLKKLPPTTIYVGEREILYPDTLLLHERAVDIGAPISVVVGTGLVHDWPASGFPIYTQTGKVRPDIYRQLGLTDTEPQELQILSAVAPEEETQARPGLINVVGSFFFNAFQAIEVAAAGQPQVPPGSTVRVQRSALDLDCGPGYTVDADWYFPDTEEPSTRLIYFQHGFPGSSAEYDYTAAELAERNQAIVVAPTVSSNLFDCYGCQLGGDPMHAVVGRLFLGGRADLLASAKAAGFVGDALPERFVIAGHSGGGQLAGGAAGYFEEFAPDDEDHNLAGVLLLDTSPIGGSIERGLAKIPDDIPVYTIAGAPSFLNSQGGVERVLEEARPNQFVGVELVNGTHGDAFQSHNPIVQIGGWIAGMGIPRSENIEAVQALTQGWVNDWYDGTHTGVYGHLGTTIDIPDTGGAQAYALPAPSHQWTIVDLVAELGLQSVTFVNVFATCAEDPSAAAAMTSCSAVPVSVLPPRKLEI